MSDYSWWQSVGLCIIAGALLKFGAMLFEVVMIMLASIGYFIMSLI